MSLFDKLVAAVTPPVSEKARADTRSKAAALAGQDDWLAMVLKHHLVIERLFDEARDASDAASRVAAAKRLAVFLGAHAAAEEVVLYPPVAEDHKIHAGMAYQEQAVMKIQLARLEMLEPMSQDWLDKLEHIRGAVLTHMYQEEGTWFPKVAREADQARQALLTRRFREEFERMAGLAPEAA